MQDSIREFWNQAFYVLGCSVEIKWEGALYSCTALFVGKKMG